MTQTAQILALEQQDSFWQDQRALVSGLAEAVPRIPPVYGYDERGATLFEEITQLPTYYLTRVERALLQRHAEDIAAAIVGPDGSIRLAELGSGSARKTGILLAACLRRGPTTYLPIDVTRGMLEASAHELCEALPGLQVRGLWGRYEAGLAQLHSTPTGPTEPLVLAFLGSSLGNTTREERGALLSEITACQRPGDGLLVSIDLRKPASVLEACYNDPPGASAFQRFRLNHLTHLNHRFHGNADPGLFRTGAHYDGSAGVVEAHLYAERAHTITLDTLGAQISLRRGDSINVGFSAKFDLAEFTGELTGYGLVPSATWTDPESGYAIILARRE